MKHKPRKPGFRLQSGRLPEQFVRAENRAEAIKIYCQRTGAKPRDFEEKEAPKKSKIEPAQTVEEVVAELEAQGEEIPTLEAEVITEAETGE